MKINEALLVGSVRQHELRESAETLNSQLQAEILHRTQVEEEMARQTLLIQASELRYRGLIESIPQIVWTATPEGVVEFANQKPFERLDLDLVTFHEAGWPALLHPEHRDRTMEQWAGGLRSGLSFEIEHRLKNRSGGFRWYLTRAVPIGGGEGQAEKWFGTSTDVEEQKRAEQAVFDKQKLESLGILAGGIAHDFNNLLTGILGGASLAADTLPDSHPLQSILSDVMRASDRAAHLTRQMLAYAGKGSFLIEQVDMNGLVRSTRELIGGSIPNHVQISFELGGDLPPVEADSSQMQQVAMNLILNAAEAIGDSKSETVMVKTELVTLTAVAIGQMNLATGALVAGAYVVLEVRDNGSGISKAVSAKIFEPFYTTKFTGRGLGLSAVEGILRTQKGAIQIESELGRGTTFRVYLPAAVWRRQEEKGSVPVEKSEPGKGSILIVDDEEIVARMFQLGLQKEGFAVSVVSGGEEAIRILQTEAERPVSLVVLDLHMPGMSGRQVMQKIRALGIEIPVLVCSGYSEEEAIREFSGLEIAGFLQKPFTGRQLANRVGEILKSRN